MPSLDVHADNKQVICVHSETRTSSSCPVYCVLGSSGDDGRGGGGC